MPESSDVGANQQATATQYNNLRKDVLDPTVGHDHSGAAGHGKIPAVAAIGTHAVTVSEVLKNSNDASKTTASTSYVKLKEIKLNEDLLVCRMKFRLATTNTDTQVWGRIYKNGVAIGTAQHVKDPAFETFSEDFADWVKDDLIQIYGYTENADDLMGVSEMRFYYDRQFTALAGIDLETALEFVAISVTNQDP